MMANVSETSTGPVNGGSIPWTEWLETLTQGLRASTARSICLLLNRLSEAPETLTIEQLRDLNLSACRLLEFAWAQEPVDSWLSVHGLVAVCRTFEGGSVASSLLIRRSLMPDHLVRFGVDELPRLADEIRRLFVLAPNLVAEVYSAAFGYEEKSSAVTQMYASQIMPLTSNRQQDYSIALFTLAQAFPTFLEAAPIIASRALIASVNAIEARQRTSRNAVPTRAEFPFLGQGAVLHLAEETHISIWNNDIGDMLKAFEEYLKRLADPAQDNASSDLVSRRAVLNLIASENEAGAVWRLLLEVGTAFPYEWGMELQELGWSVPILTGISTNPVISTYLASIFEASDAGARERIERAILSIGDRSFLNGEEGQRAATRMRDRLLRRLPAGALVTAEARIIHSQTDQAAVVVEEEFNAYAIASDGFVDAEDPLVASILEQAGYKVDSFLSTFGASARLVQEFVEQYRNDTTNAEAITIALPNLQELYEGLSSAPTYSLSPEQQTLYWNYLTEACAVIANARALDCDTPIGAFIRNVLLEASLHSEPRYLPQQDAQFDDFPSWGTAPRINAARGLMWLIQSGNCVDKGVLDAIERLSQDEVPAVRLQVAVHSARLYLVDSERMWRIIDHMCRDEPRNGVLQQLVMGSLSSLLNVQPERVIELLQSVYHRASEGPGAQAMRDNCLPALITLYVDQDNAVCRDFLFDIAQTPSQHSKSTKRTAHILRDSGALTCGPVDPPDPQQERKRQRALELFAALVRSACENGRALIDSLSAIPLDDWIVENKIKMQGCQELVGSLSKQIFFASGAFEAQRHRTKFDRDLQCRFLHEMALIMDDLAALGFVFVAQDLIQALFFLLPCDPQEVFERIGKIVASGSKQGYQFEGMAADLIVRLVECILAEYRPMLRDDSENRRVLIELLDTFMRAGWPQAQRLTCHLEEIFR